MRILLDTNILARAAAGPPGLANELVLAATRPQHTLLLSPPLLLELDRVLRYDRLRPIHGLDDPGIQQYLTDLVLVAEMVVPPVGRPAIIPVDPDDDPIVATAVAGNADVLCTRDRHFFRPEVLVYCHGHPIQIVGELELLARLKTA